MGQGAQHDDLIKDENTCSGILVHAHKRRNCHVHNNSADPSIGRRVGVFAIDCFCFIISLFPMTSHTIEFHAPNLSYQTPRVDVAMEPNRYLEIPGANGGNSRGNAFVCGRRSYVRRKLYA